MNWIVATNFRDKAQSTPIFLLQLCANFWSAARNIPENEALANIAKNFLHTNKNWFTVYTDQATFGSPISDIATDNFLF